jgi:rhodanese-related sulfurtransferase
MNVKIQIFYFIILSAYCSVNAGNDFNTVNKNDDHYSSVSDSGSVKHKTISLTEAYNLFKDKQALFIDSRHPFLFKKAHIRDAVLIYFRTADTNSVFSLIDRAQPVVLYCGGPECDQANTLADIMIRKGYTGIMIFSGGMDEWRTAGYPLDEGKNK